jgi:ureidoacrylate peracid hydrolase
MDSLQGTVTVDARLTPFTLDPGRAAVIVVDMQNEFASEGGAFARMGVDITPIQQIIAPTARVLAGARRAGLKVVYLKYEHRPDRSDIGAPDSKSWGNLQAAGVGAPVTGPEGQASRVFIQDTWGTDIVPELAPEPTDLVVSKHRFSGFYETDLDLILRGLGIRGLVFTGCTTSVCVESTLRDAMYRDYRCLLLADCTAEPIGNGLVRSNHEASLLVTQITFGWVSDSLALLQALAAGPAGAVSPAGPDPLAIVERLEAAANAGDL